MDSRSRNPFKAHYVFALLVGVLSVLPTILNRFPLVYFDTGTYVSAWTTNQHLYFPAFYPFFVWLTSRAVNIYFTVVSQAVLSIYVLWSFFQAFLRQRQPAVPLGLIAATLLLTQLPWLINWLMSDLFFGLGAICIMAYVLLYENIDVRRKIILFLIAVFSTIVATANVLVLIPFGLSCIVLRKFVLKKLCHSRIIAAALLFSTLVIGLSTASGYIINGRPVMNATWAALSFNKLVRTGIAQEFLHANCSQNTFKMCEYLDDLDKIHDSGFLWNGLADQVDAWHDPTGDLGRTVVAIVQGRFSNVVAAAFRDITALLFSPTLGRNELNAYSKETGVYFNIAAFYPASLPNFVASQQQAGNVSKFFPERYYSLLTYLSYGLIVFLTIGFSARSDRLGASVGIAALILVVLGIAVHAGLTTPEARYQVKVSWVAGVVAIAGVFRWYNLRTRTNVYPGTGDETPNNCTLPIVGESR